MSRIFHHFSLKERNSFGLDVSALYFYEAGQLEDLLDFYREGFMSGLEYLILGEGSNVLFVKDFGGVVVHPALKGIEILREDCEKIVVKASAGESWDSLVAYCVERNWSGLENLSLIPGSVGSSPVQNIGAYGVEVKDRVIEVEGFFTDECRLRTLTKDECRFGYRNSIFKNEYKGRFLITSVSFELDKNPTFVLNYGNVEKEFLSRPSQNLSTLRETIISIRNSKLPDPVKLGNAGSFFKNPVIPEEQYNSLRKKYPSIPSYEAGAGTRKIPAAWLIEMSGWKGVRMGNTGTFPSQPLVIVNYGGATGREIYEFAIRIMESVEEKSGIRLELEVNLAG